MPESWSEGAADRPPGPVPLAQPRGDPQPRPREPAPLPAHRPPWLQRHSGWLGLIVILLLGAIGRFALSLRDGHLADVDIFLNWMRSLVEHGLSGFYGAGRGNYPPLHVLTLYGLGELLARFDPELARTLWLRAWLRLPACLADVLIAIVLYIEARRALGRRAGLAAAALYFLNPVSLYNSAYWGQVDSIHSLFVLAAVAALNRVRPFWAGVAIALALLQKLQAIAFLPLVLLDVYRWRRMRGLVSCAGGAAVAAAVVLAPFVYAGGWSWPPEVLVSALEHGYVRVVGQYDRLSINAFNLWHALGISEMTDAGVPPFLVHAAAQGDVSVGQGEHWLLLLTWRRLGVVLCGVSMAAALAVYSRRRGAAARSLAAGLLGLAFFLFLTEMHERYAFTVIAVLPIWAATGRWRERLFVLLSAAMLLNLAAVQTVEEIGAELAGLHLLLGGVLLVAMLAPAPLASRAGEAEPAVPRVSVVYEREAPRASVLITLFRLTTLAAVLAAAGVAGWVAYQHRSISTVPAPGTIHLSELTPVSVTQGFGRLSRDRSVGGGVIHLGDGYYLRGLGTHAPSTIVYEIPAGQGHFQAVAGVNRSFRGRVRLEVYLDGKLAVSSPPLSASDSPIDLRVPLEGAKQLKLVAHSLNDKKGDHVDWALARLVP